MVNISIGEILVSARKGEVILRPSLLAMSRIGDPKEIIWIYEQLITGTINRQNIGLSQHVISCCASEDVDWLTGWIQEGFDGNLKVMAGQMPVTDLILIATHLMKWGIAGNPKTSSGGEPMVSFDASEIVGAAVRHFGIQPDTAWNMCMTEFQRIYEAGVSNDNKKPDAEKHKAFMSRMDKVNQKMNQRH